MAKSKLLQQVREKIRRKNYSYRTEQSYLRWIIRFIKFCGTKHPQNIKPNEIERFLTFLAVEKNVAASTQNQALCAIVFLYKQVLEDPLPQLKDIQWAKKPTRMIEDCRMMIGDLRSKKHLKSTISIFEALCVEINILHSLT